MSFLDRIRGKKKDDFGLDNPGDMFQNNPNPQDGFVQFPDMNQPIGALPTDQFAAPNQNQFSSQPAAQYPQQYPDASQQQPQRAVTPEELGFERVPDQQSPQRGGSNQSLGEINLGKDMEIISAKLDAIKAELDSINQRLKRVERLAEGSSAQGHKDSWSY